MKKNQIEPFFATLKAANPQPNTELEYTSVFELLTAVLLSAQATDVGVNKATRRLFAVAHTPARILALGLEGLEAHIRTIGLYHSKARHLLQTCEILLREHGGEVPKEMGLLQRIPPAYLVDAHHWLILLGRYVCQARKPMCWQCAVASNCAYRPKTPAPV